MDEHSDRYSPQFEAFVASERFQASRQSAARLDQEAAHLLYALRRKVADARRGERIELELSQQEAALADLCETLPPAEAALVDEYRHTLRTALELVRGIG
jgi:hypothetical protein